MNVCVHHGNRRKEQLCGQANAQSSVSSINHLCHEYYVSGMLLLYWCPAVCLWTNKWWELMQVNFTLHYSRLWSALLLSSLHKGLIAGLAIARKLSQVGHCVLHSAQSCALDYHLSMDSTSSLDPDTSHCLRRIVTQHDKAITSPEELEVWLLDQCESSWAYLALSA